MADVAGHAVTKYRNSIIQTLCSISIHCTELHGTRLYKCNVPRQWISVTQDGEGNVRREEHRTARTVMAWWEGCHPTCGRYGIAPWYGMMTNMMTRHCCQNYACCLHLATANQAHACLQHGLEKAWPWPWRSLRSITVSDEDGSSQSTTGVTRRSNNIVIYSNVYV